MSQVSRSRSKKLAEFLDSKFTIPGTGIRFGIDPVIGLIPGAGDWLAGVFSIYFLFQAILAGARSPVLIRMFLNVLLDIVIGAIPVIGEIFDVAWKANMRNARLLQKLEEKPVETQRESRRFNWFLLALFVAVILALLFVVSWLFIELMEWLF